MTVLRDWETFSSSSAGSRRSTPFRRTCSPRAGTSWRPTRPATVSSAASSPPTSRLARYGYTSRRCARSSSKFWTRPSRGRSSRRCTTSRRRSRFGCSRESSACATSTCRAWSSSPTRCSSTPSPSTSGTGPTRASGTRTATCPSEAPGRPSCARSGVSTTPTAARLARDDVLSLIANGRLDGCPSPSVISTRRSRSSWSPATRRHARRSLRVCSRSTRTRTSGACCATTSASYPEPSRRCCAMRILSGTSGAPPPV